MHRFSFLFLKFYMHLYAEGAESELLIKIQDLHDSENSYKPLQCFYLFNRA